MTVVVTSTRRVTLTFSAHTRDRPLLQLAGSKPLSNKHRNVPAFFRRVQEVGLCNVVYVKVQAKLSTGVTVGLRLKNFGDG